jgi:hypothetical protein
LYRTGGWVGTSGSSPCVKRLRGETDYLHLVPRLIIGGSTPPYVFMAPCLITHRDNFT